MDDVFIGAIQMNAIDFEKSQHDVHADALVSIHKSVVGDQCKAEARAFFSLLGYNSCPSKVA